jgi:cbb3-type cytochrome oxidase subunit 3
MTAAEVSLLAVTSGFVMLLWWVYSPRRRNRLESYGAMPLERDDDEPGCPGDRP